VEWVDGASLKLLDSLELELQEPRIMRQSYVEDPTMSFPRKMDFENAAEVSQIHYHGVRN
jgi:hypothetical protein